MPRRQRWRPHLVRSGVLVSVSAEFVRYFERQLLPFYQENVSVGPGFNQWTNNACESENHVLKKAVQWRPKQLPDLIECVYIRRLVTGQYADPDQAICGLGDFVLHKNNAFSIRAGTAAGVAFSSTGLGIGLTIYCIGLH